MSLPFLQQHQKFSGQSLTLECKLEYDLRCCEGSLCDAFAYAPEGTLEFVALQWWVQ